jgi:hypothetical protein
MRINAATHAFPFDAAAEGSGVFRSAHDRVDIRNIEVVLTGASALDSWSQCLWRLRCGSPEREATIACHMSVILQVRVVVNIVELCPRWARVFLRLRKNGAEC